MDLDCDSIYYCFRENGFTILSSSSSGFVYLVKDYCCANFRNQQSFLTRLKYNTKISIFANHYIFI